MPGTSLAPGAVLQDTYRIVRRVGGGGMGEVYEARHDRLSGRYAVKVLNAEMAGHPEALLRFRREAQVTSSLQHPGIVQVIDFNETSDGLPYLVMEYLEGGDLAHVIARSAPLPVQRVVDIVEQIASALAAAHRRGIVHRDLKPQNVFVLAVDGRDVVKLVDFGISKIRSASQQLTRESTLLGTPQYMAPEQATGNTDAVDARSDQFALAAIAYEMLGGRPPFTGDSLPAVVYQIVEMDPTALAAVPPAVEAVVRRGLAKRPEARFPSVTGLATALSAAAHGVLAPADLVDRSSAAAGSRGAIADRDGSGRAPQTAFADTTLGTATGQLTAARTTRRRRRARAVLLVAVTGASAGLAMALLWSRTASGPAALHTAAPSAGTAAHVIHPAPAAADAPSPAAPQLPAHSAAPTRPPRPHIDAAARSEGSPARAAAPASKPHRSRAKRAAATRPETQAPAKKTGEVLVDDL